MSRRDVVVIGAGPAGAATAHYLAARGADVLLVDRAHFPRDKTCGDGLTPRAVDVLDDMGLVPFLLAAGQRVDRVEIVAPAGLATRAAIGRAGSAAYALVVPRRRLDDAIRARAVASGASWRGGLDVVAVAPDQAGVTIEGRDVDGPVTLRARVAVIATGASVGLLRRSGLLARTPLMLIAARAYFEGIEGPADRLQLRFDGVPLPGYGWVFPVSPTAANVGVGYFAPAWRRRWRRITARTAFDAFVAAPAVRAALGRASMIGRVQGYPLRVDFPGASTVAEGVLVVGEAAGLVNPLTGEGIDYALESGRLAGEHLAELLAAGDLSPGALGAYDQALRARFQRLFAFCAGVRRWLVHRTPLDLLVSMAERRADLRTTLVDIVLGHRPVAGRVSLTRATRLLLSR
jgi:geranylgeranyl reductase family protein